MPKIAIDAETSEALKAIAIEVSRAESLHPVWPLDIFRQSLILMEEAGEVAKAVNDFEFKGNPLSDVETELTQTGAMCVRMLKELHKQQEVCYDCGGTKRIEFEREGSAK